MSRNYVFVVWTSLTLVTHVFSAPLDQLLPWLEPNPLAFGTSFQSFVQAHPSAKEAFPNEHRLGESFNGEMSEEAGDRSLIISGFVNNELASIGWASSANLDESVQRIRNALLSTHGQPTLEYAARIDSQGSIAKIVREVYRPPVDKNCVVCLLATTDGGVEVDVKDEAIFRKYGRPTSRQTYEAAVQAASQVVQPNPKPSLIVDLLAKTRASAQPQVLVPPVPPVATPAPTETPARPSPTPTVAESPEAVVERKSAVWPWLVGMLVLVVIVAVALKRRA